MKSNVTRWQSKDEENTHQNFDNAKIWFDHNPNNIFFANIWHCPGFGYTKILVWLILVINQTAPTCRTWLHTYRFYSGTGRNGWNIICWHPNRYTVASIQYRPQYRPFQPFRYSGTGKKNQN